jgi:DNA excision repair protein ERCC-6
MIVGYSNNYASNKNQSLEIDVNELKCFLGILLLSGYNELSRRHMYWEKSPDTHNDLVSGAMRRNRFEQIFSYIHFCDNSKLDEHDKFSKIRPLLFMLNSRFLIHTPHQQFHGIDESMVPYFGRHGCKQFIRGKPIRFGFKIWVGTLRLGYVVWISPYQGKSGDLQNLQKYGLGASIIISYANNLLAHRIAPYHLVFDNFFTGLTLLEKLSEMDLYGTGTIRSNRTKKCPINLAAMKKKERGSYESYVSDSGILVCAWKDNSTVTIVSNNVGVEPVITAKRWFVSHKRSIRLPQPQLIHLYNQNMGGVDRMNQNVSQYRISIRGKKWYSCIVSYSIDLAVQNVWQLHKLHTEKSMDLLAFRRHIATYNNLIFNNLSILKVNS